jgi:Fe-S cluster assembly protein SufD
MTQAAATNDRFLAGFQALDATVSREQPGWLQALRRQALAHFQQTGLPVARKGNEPWKYTNIAPIAGTPFALSRDGSSISTADLARLVPADEAWHTLVFVNARFSPALSSRGALDGVVAGSLAALLATHGQLIEEHLGRRVPYAYDGFTALNTAFLADGAIVHIPDGVELKRPVNVVFLAAPEAQPAAAYPRLLLLAGRNSKATVIETYAGLGGGTYLSNGVTEITLEDGAELEHYRVLLDRSYHVGVTRVLQERDTTLRSLSFASGPEIGRNDFGVLLDAEGAECYLKGLYVAAGKQHIDNYLNIDHAKPHGTSRLYYKGILDDESRAAFGGMVLVRPGAQKTDSHQEDKNLLLSEKAEVDSKPSLEIYADDVKCGHGATAGAVAEDALFYMRSRGFDEQTAQLFLVKGFAREILDGIALEPLREYLERFTAAALPRFSRREAA